MTSTTRLPNRSSTAGDASSKPSAKSSSAWPLFRDLCRRNAWIGVVLLVVWMLLLISDVLTRPVEASLPQPVPDAKIMQHGTMLGIMLSFVACYASVRHAFGYLYDRTAAPFFGSLPLRRRSLYLVTFAAAVVPLLVAIALLAALLLAFAANGLVSLDAALQWTGVQLLLLACFAGLAVLAVQLCGRRFPAFVTYCMLNGYVVVVEWGVRTLLSLMMPSVVQVASSLRFGWASPLYQFADLFVLHTYGVDSVLPEAWATLDAYALVGVGLAVLSGWLFCRRDLERAGDGFAFPQVHAVVSVLFSVAAGLGLTLVVLLVFDLGNMDTYGMVVAPLPLRICTICTIVILSLVTYLVAERVLGNDLVSTKKHPAAFMATLVASAALAVVCTTNVTGIVSYVPEAQDIASANVSGMQVSLDDEDAIQAVCDLHQAILEDSDDSIQSQEDEDAWNVTITYHLKSGKDIIRTYDVALTEDQQVAPGSAAYVLDTFMGNAAVCHCVEQAAENALMPNEDTPEVTIFPYDETNWEVSYDGQGSQDVSYVEDATEEGISVSQDSAPALLAAIKEDLSSCGAWCILPFFDDGVVGNVDISVEGSDSDYLAIYLSEEHSPAILAWAQAQVA